MNPTRYEILLAETRQEYRVRLTERDLEVLAWVEREVEDCRRYVEENTYATDNGRSFATA